MSNMADVHVRLRWVPGLNAGDEDCELFSLFHNNRLNRFTHTPEHANTYIVDYAHCSAAEPVLHANAKSTGAIHALASPVRVRMRRLPSAASLPCALPWRAGARALPMQPGLMGAAPPPAQKHRVHVDSLRNSCGTYLSDLD